jgi:hypothetical protein
MKHAKTKKENIMNNRHRAQTSFPRKQVVVVVLTPAANDIRLPVRASAAHDRATDE